MNDLLEQYKLEHPLLSADELRSLKRFVQYTELRLRTCTCGQKFRPNTPRNIKCPDCASNGYRYMKMKGMNRI